MVIRHGDTIAAERLMIAKFPELILQDRGLLPESTGPE